MLRDSVNMSLHAIPPNVDQEQVAEFLKTWPGVTAIHDLHIWSMSTTEVALTAHLVRPGASIDDAFSQAVAHDLDHRFGIAHATIQIEAAEHDHGCTPVRRSRHQDVSTAA